MGTTPNGIVYPDPSGVPSRQALQDLAESVDAKLPIIGSVNISGTSLAAGAGVSQTFNFGITFASPPYVIAQAGPFVTGSGSIVVRSVDQITASGARLVVINAGPTAATWTNLPVIWFAFST